MAPSLFMMHALIVLALFAALACTQTTCRVDAAASGLDENIYQTVQAALGDSKCTGPDAVILVQNTQNNYEKDLAFKADNIQLHTK